MGCGASKAGLQGYNGGASAGGASPVGRTASLRKGGSSPGVPGADPGGFFSGLAQATGACQGARVAPLLEYIKATAAADLHAVSAGSEDSIRERAQLAADACSALLKPTQRIVEEALVSGTDGSSWAHASCADLRRLYVSGFRVIAAASSEEGGNSVTADTVRNGVARVLAAVFAIADAAKAELEREVYEGLSFELPAFNDVLSSAALVVCRQVTHEAPSAYQKRCNDVEELMMTVGAPKIERFPHVLSASSKAFLLYLQASRDATEQSRKFDVARGNAFESSFKALNLRLNQNSTLVIPKGTGAHAMPCKLFPRFMSSASEGPSSDGYPEDGEGHGPRKEFFLLAGQRMTGNSGEADTPASLFVYNRTSGSFWFNTTLKRSIEYEAMFEHAGWLAAQTVYNRAVLGMPLAPLIFRKVLEGSRFKPDLDTLRAHDPDAAAGIARTHDLSDSDFASFLEMDGMDVASTSREAYVEHAVQMLLVDDCAWQYDAFQHGYYTATRPKALTTLQFTPLQLAAVTCGPMLYGGASGKQPDFDLQKVFRIALDDALRPGGEYEVLADVLFEVIGAWPLDLRYKLLHFLTGSTRLPLPNTEVLRVEVPFVPLSQVEHAAALASLPTAHTCDNLLEMPNYAESFVALRNAAAGGGSGFGVAWDPKMRPALVRHLDCKLTQAVTLCGGYGLDTTADDEAQLPVISDYAAAVLTETAANAGREADHAHAHAVEDAGLLRASGTTVAKSDLMQGSEYSSPRRPTDQHDRHDRNNAMGDHDRDDAVASSDHARSRSARTHGSSAAGARASEGAAVEPGDDTVLRFDDDEGVKGGGAHEHGYGGYKQSRMKPADSPVSSRGGGGGDGGSFLPPINPRAGQHAGKAHGAGSGGTAGLRLPTSSDDEDDVMTPYGGAGPGPGSRFGGARRREEHRASGHGSADELDGMHLYTPPRAPPPRPRGLQEETDALLADSYGANYGTSADHSAAHHHQYGDSSLYGVGGIHPQHAANLRYGGGGGGLGETARDRIIPASLPTRAELPARPPPAQRRDLAGTVAGVEDDFSVPEGGQGIHPAGMHRRTPSDEIESMIAAMDLAPM